MSEHIHMLVRAPPQMSVSGFTGFSKGKSADFINDRDANLTYKYGNQSFWSKCYYVSTIGLNHKTIRKYI